MGRGVFIGVFIIALSLCSPLLVTGVVASGSLVIPYGGSRVITGKASFSSISGAGHNSLSVVNAVLTVGSINLSGSRGNTVTIVNSTIYGLGKPMIFNSYSYLLIMNVSVSGFTSDTVVLILRGVKNSSVDGFRYTYTKSAVATSMVAISIEGCTNLTLSNIKGVGLTNVNTPHFHTSFAGATPSVNVTISNSYFYGGGNGGTSSNVRYVNCTWESVVDGTERQKVGDTEFIGCKWIGTKDSEVNLQNGVTYRFINCSFSKGLINAANGYAEFVNCSSSSGWTWAEMKDNDNTHKYLGSAVINGVNYEWVKVRGLYVARIGG